MNPSSFPVTANRHATIGSGASLLPPPPTVTAPPYSAAAPPSVVPDPMTEFLRLCDKAMQICGESIDRSHRISQYLKEIRPLLIKMSPPSPDPPQLPSPVVISPPPSANPDLSRPPLPLEDLDLDLLHPRPPLVELESPPVVDLPSPPLKTTLSSPELRSSPPLSPLHSLPDPPPIVVQQLDELLPSPTSLSSASLLSLFVNRPPLLLLEPSLPSLEKEGAAQQPTLEGQWAGTRAQKKEQAHQQSLSFESMKPKPEFSFVLYPLEIRAWAQEMKVKPIFYVGRALGRFLVGKEL